MKYGNRKTQQHRQPQSQLTVKVGVAEESLSMWSRAGSNLTTRLLKQTKKSIKIDIGNFMGGQKEGG